MCGQNLGVGLAWGNRTKGCAEEAATDRKLPETGGPGLLAGIDRCAGVVG
jgi:hypothetical protein